MRGVAAQHPICKDCKYFYPNVNYSTRSLRLEKGLCKHPKSCNVDLVTGEHTYKSCFNMRKYEACSDKGILFEKESNILSIALHDMPSGLDIFLYTMYAVWACAILVMISSIVQK